LKDSDKKEGAKDVSLRQRTEKKTHHEAHEGHEGLKYFILLLRALRDLRGEMSVSVLVCGFAAPGSLWLN
jgi:hypothetical protein